MYKFLVFLVKCYLVADRTFWITLKENFPNKAEGFTFALKTSRGWRTAKPGWPRKAVNRTWTEHEETRRRGAEEPDNGLIGSRYGWDFDNVQKLNAVARTYISVIKLHYIHNVNISGRL